MLVIADDFEVQLQSLLKDIVSQQEVDVVDGVLWLQLDVPPVRGLGGLRIVLCETLCPV